MRRILPTFHEMAGPTRSDCSGPKACSQAFYRQFSFRFPGHQPLRGLFVRMKAVKRLPIRESALLIKHVVPALWKPVHSLWNEVIGFLFFCLAVVCGFPAVRHLHDHDKKAYMMLPIILLLLWFGVDAFRRARKISRS
jgi:hypothetical protein